jgi:hypothetical protein
LTLAITIPKASGFEAAATFYIPKDGRYNASISTQDRDYGNLQIDEPGIQFVDTVFCKLERLCCHAYPRHLRV